MIRPLTSIPQIICQLFIEYPLGDKYSDYFHDNYWIEPSVVSLFRETGKSLCQTLINKEKIIDMQQASITKAPCIEVVDSLRGFAVMAILLVHNLEHFIFPVYPDPANVLGWLNAMDDSVHVTFSLIYFPFVLNLAQYCGYTVSLVIGFTFSLVLQSQIHFDQ